MFWNEPQFRSDEVGRIVKICKTALSEAKDLAKEYGKFSEYSYLHSYLSFKDRLDEEAYAFFKEYGDANVTDSAIYAYLDVTKRRLEDCKMFERLDIFFDRHIDGEDSHLYIALGGEQLIEELDEGDMRTFVTDVIADRLLFNIERYLRGSGSDKIYFPKFYSKEYVEKDLKDGRYSREDIIDCLEHGTVSGTIKETVDKKAVDINKVKDDKERD